MQWVGYAELASAVSNAGGLGIVGSSIQRFETPNIDGVSTVDCLDTTIARRASQGNPKMSDHD